MTELQVLVKAAQDGDQVAFSRVVMRFQDMAYASAYATVVDAGLKLQHRQVAKEGAFYCMGTIDQAVAKARHM